MKRFVPWGLLAVLLLFSAGFDGFSGSSFRGVRHAHVPNGAAFGDADSSILGLLRLAAEYTGTRPAPRMLALYDRQDVIPAPRVDFARVADIDGDGDPDVLAVEPEQEDIHWWENLHGDGSEFAEHTITTFSQLVTVVSPGDLNSNGDIDFLALAPQSGTLSLWLNDGSGNFTEMGDSFRLLGTTYVEAADVNDDGYADFFSIQDNAEEIDWWENNAQPEDIDFERHRITSNSALAGTVTRVDAADIDGDGRVDFVGANPDGGEISWWRHEVNEQSGHVFENQTPNAYREDAVLDVSAADVDGDADLDIFAARSMPYRVFLWENRGDADFRRFPQSLSESPGDRPWRSLDSGDMNGDGAPDFIVSEWEGQLCWYENPNVVQPSPTATATAPTSTSTPTLTPIATSTATTTPTATATLTVTPTVDEEYEIYLPLIRRSP